MRATEFILEDVESISVFLILSGFNINQIRTELQDSWNDFSNGEIPFHVIEDNLYKIEKQIRNIMISDIWDRLIDDPDRIIVFKQIVELSREINSYLK